MANVINSDSRDIFSKSSVQSSFLFQRGLPENPCLFVFLKIIDAIQNLESYFCILHNAFDSQERFLMELTRHALAGFSYEAVVVLADDVALTRISAWPVFDGAFD